jgi:hypothetical protein
MMGNGYKKCCMMPAIGYMTHIKKQTMKPMVASFVTNDMPKVSTTRNPNFFDREFWLKNPPNMVFLPSCPT